MGGHCQLHPRLTRDAAVQFVVGMWKVSWCGWKIMRTQKPTVCAGNVIDRRMSPIDLSTLNRMIEMTFKGQDDKHNIARK